MSDNSENIPAWKRIGLKVKEAIALDPLAIATHLDSGKVTKKQVKQLNKRQKLQDSPSDGTKKPPKRVKVAKSERAPPPEKDQLVYLKTYTTDKDNWKFSKQKQNWILKHIKTIDSKYEEYLVNYLVGLQGGSRDRVVEELTKVVESWNTAANEPVKETKQEASTEESKDTTTTEKKEPVKKEELESVDSDYALRAKKIIEAITGNEIELVGIKEDEEMKETEEPEKEKEQEPEVEETSKPKEDGPVTSSSNTDNLIIEEVEVTEFVDDKDLEDAPEEEQVEQEQVEQPTEQPEEEEKSSKKKKKKSKKSKKEKKSSKESSSD